MRKRCAIVVHRGAGDEIEPKAPEEQAPFLQSLCEVLDAGKAVVERGDGGLTAVDCNGNVATPLKRPQIWRDVADSDRRYAVMLDQVAECHD